MARKKEKNTTLKNGQKRFRVLTKKDKDGIIQEFSWIITDRNFIIKVRRGGLEKKNMVNSLILHVKRFYGLDIKQEDIFFEDIFI